jgi:lambda family phage portal protein
MPMLATLGRALQRIGSGLAPQVKSQATYEGASQTRRARGWFAPTIGANSGVVYSLRTIRDRSRAANRNDGYSRSAIDKTVSNLVGTGVVPQSKAPDDAFRERLHQLYFDWTDQADSDGLRDFNGLQALAARGWMEGGEMFLRLRPRLPKDGLVVPLQLQLLEPELVPHEYTTRAANGNPIRAGIEFDPIGRRAAYWCWQQRPEQLDPFADGGAMVRVPADSMVHLYEPVRAGQIRGLPQLTQAIVALHDIDKFKDATLIRQQLSNLFVGFVKPPAATTEADVDPLTGRAIEMEGDNAIVPLEPGLFQELAPGEDVTWSDPPEATGYGDFMREQLMAAAVAADVPYEVLTGDMRGINDRTVRVILGEFRRRIEQRQHHTLVFTMLRPIWLAFLDRAILSGALPVPSAYWADPLPWQRVEWMPPTWPYLNPVQDIEYRSAMVRNGFTSRSRAVKELNSADAEVIDAEIAADKKRAEALGLAFDSDGWRAKSGAAPAPEPEPDEEKPPTVVVAPVIHNHPAPAVTGRQIVHRDAQGFISRIDNHPLEPAN